MRVRWVVGALVGMAAGAGGAWGEKHRLHQVRDDAVDLVLHASWDFNTPGEGDKAYLTEALRMFADRTYDMTEGRIKVCKLYVYRDNPKVERKADIVMRPEGRSNADLGALFADGRVNAYRHFVGSAGRSARDFGNTLAHEFGHYGLSLKDEYEETVREAGQQSYLSPRSCDVTITSMMGSKRFEELSVRSDYESVDFPAWTVKPMMTVGASQREKYLDCEKLVRPPDGAATSENAQWRTAQWRSYQRSSWEVLGQSAQEQPLGAAGNDAPRLRQMKSITAGGLPTRLRTQAFTDPCHEVIFMDGAFVVLLVDRSNSMNQMVSPTRTVFDVAKDGAKKFVSSAVPGTTILLLGFADETTVVLPPVLIDRENTAARKAQLTAAIDGMVAETSGGTNVNAALVEATNQFIKGASIGNYEFMVTVSDGVTNLEQHWLTTFVGLSIPIFTQGVGRVDELDLRRMSRVTEGLYRTQAWEYGHIKEELLARERLGERMFGRPVGNEPMDAPVDVHPLDGATRFRARWQEGDPVRYELEAPDGTVVTPTNLPAGITFSTDDRGAVFTVDQPMPGVWKPRMVPESLTVRSGAEIDVASETPLAMAVTATGYAQYPDPWFVRATVGAPHPITGARVVGTLRKGDLVIGLPISFSDDGTGADLVPSDGVYSAALSGVTENGAYTLEVVANDPGGAVIDPNVGDEPAPVVAPTPLLGFTRRRTLDLDAQGFRPMPASPAQAEHIRNDLTAVWGTINQPGDVVWYSFNGYKKGEYAAMTGQLLANDGGPMRTRLSLYDTDGVTLLDESANSDGRGWVELRTGDSDGKYYLKVEHAAGGVGRFRIAVAPQAWFDEPGGSDGPCGCRVGTRTQAPGVLILVLAALLIWRRRRRSVRSG